MTRFEFDPSKLVVNDVDLSGHLYNVDMSHDVGEKCTWGEKLAGLKSFSHAVTFDSAITDDQVLEFAGVFQDADGGYIWSSRATTPVKYEVPDGKWQAFKHRLKARWPRLLRRLKIRYITYSFDAELSSEMATDGAFSISGRAAGPLSKGTETR